MPTLSPLANLTPACQLQTKRAAYVLLALPLAGAVGGYMVLRGSFPLSGLIGAIAGMILVPKFVGKPLINAIMPVSCQAEVKAEVVRLRTTNGVPA